MPDYQQGKIYKLVSDLCDGVYYGSTTLPLMERWIRHKSNYYKWKRGDGYGCGSFKLFDDYGVDNFRIELIEDYPCDNSEELHIREQYYLDNNECVNEQRAHTSPEEAKIQKQKYNQERKEYFAEKKHELYEKKKHQILEKNREKITCVCGREVRKVDLARHLKTKIHAELLNLTI